MVEIIASHAGFDRIFYTEDVLKRTKPQVEMGDIVLQHLFVTPLAFKYEFALWKS